ncbi:MAG: hypothetical protein F4205_01585 [Gemmatimonadetes bacterium]|nr:hypothetical protein [Gemmatimonadota bacterium]MYG34159.1 hypothetical protein [Gemmatimonadota bacterium]
MSAKKLTVAITLEGAKALVPGAAPLIGIAQSLYSARGERFLRTIEERLSALEDAEPDPERLASAIAEIQRRVLATPIDQQDRLVNAAVNSAVSRSLAESDRRRFMLMLEYFSELHFRVLEILSVVDDPHGGLADSLRGRVERHTGSIDDQVFSRVWGDLHRERLVAAREPNAMGTPGGMAGKRTEPLADSFLRFVSMPSE